LSIFHHYLYGYNSSGTELGWWYTGDVVPAGPGVIDYSSPAIGKNGLIYFGSRVKQIYALSQDFPFPVWEWTISTNGWAGSSSPCIGPDNEIYCSDYSGYLYSIVKPEGEAPFFNWTFKAENDFYMASPVIGPNGTIYIGDEGGRFYAINSENGVKKWSHQTEDKIYSTAVIGSDSTIYFGSDDNKIRALTIDGQLKWIFETGGKVQSSGALSEDGVLYIGSNDNKLYAIQTESKGLANSSWPKFRHDNKNTGNVNYLSNKEDTNVYRMYLNTHTDSQWALDHFLSEDLPNWEGNRHVNFNYLDDYIVQRWTGTATKNFSIDSIAMYMKLKCDGDPWQTYTPFEMSLYHLKNGNYNRVAWAYYKVQYGNSTPNPYPAETFIWEPFSIQQGDTLTLRIELLKGQSTGDVIEGTEASHITFFGKNGNSTNIKIFEKQTRFCRIYPNPFDSYTTIEFSLQKSSKVRLNIFNANGEIVSELINGVRLNSGEHQIIFDGTSYASGIYFYSIHSDYFYETGKMIFKGKK